MLVSLACLFGFLAMICAPGLIAQAIDERNAATVSGEE